MSNYIDEKIIPLKLEHCGNEGVSLKEGYFIDGKLEIFIKKRKTEMAITPLISTQKPEISKVLYTMMGKV